MKKIFTIIIMILLTWSVTQAQDKSAAGYMPHSYYTYSWNVTFPIGDFNKWVGEPSAAGFDIGGRYLLPGGILTGFNCGWQRIAKDYANQTVFIPDKGIAITATNYRFTWMIPFQVVIGYQLHPQKLVSPYFTLGIGGDYMEHHLMIQEYDIYEDYWDFSLTPEIGATIKFGAYSHWGGLLAFNYKWTTNHVEALQEKSKAIQMLNLKVGLAYIIR